MEWRLIALVAALLTAHQPGGATQQASGTWSGAWTSRGDRDVQIVSIRPGSGSPRGWHGFVEALLATRPYRIAITQTADRIAIDFPGGAANMLTLPETPLDNEPAVRVVNRGEWWTKYVTASRAAGSVVDVAATTFTGWWRDGGPDGAEPAATDFRRRYLLSPGTAADQLELRIHLSDEKGDVEYVQRFRREP